jgi:hypothetical protein
MRGTAADSKSCSTYYKFMIKLGLEGISNHVVNTTSEIMRTLSEEQEIDGLESQNTRIGTL